MLSSTPHGFVAPSPLATSAGESHSETAPPASPTSTTRRRSRSSSFTESVINSRPPLGAMAATGEAFGRAPSWADLCRNSAGSGRRISVGRRGSSISTGGGMSPAGVNRNMPIQEGESEDIREALRHPAVVNSLVDAAEESEKLGSRDSGDAGVEGESEDEEKPGAWAATKSGLLGFWMWFKKPVGFFVTIYMLNIVAWGGMLFLLICHAAPAMCKPTCNAINSPRSIWIEIDSQILNGLFCVTGFGLAPWRFRDLYYLLKWRCYGKQSGYLKLQEINQNWYRPGPAASGSPEAIGSSIDTAATDDIGTVTGKRAPPTKSWKLDYVIWLYVWNTFFQCCLCGFMWGMNRYQRPSWSTGFFVALACIVAMMAGGQVWWETRKVKRVEGDKKEEEKKEEEKKEEEKKEEEKKEEKAKSEESKSSNIPLNVMIG